MAKRIIVLMTVVLGIAALAGCNKSQSTASASGTGTAPQKLDMTAFALAAATPLSAEDAAVDWLAKSNNPNKVVWRHGGTARNLDESPVERTYRQFFIEMKKRLGDKIEIQIYMNGTLGTSADAILGGIQARSFESYGYNVGAFAEYTNAFLPLDVLYLVPDFESGIAVCEGEPGELMRQKCIADTGLNVLIYTAIGMRNITNSKRPIHIPKDLNGLKIRVQNNPLHIMGMTELGASPTPIAYAELFTSLQQKVVDAQENPVSNIFDQNYGEVQSYMTLSRHLYTAGAFPVNQSWLNEQNNEFKQAVRESVAVCQRYTRSESLKVEETLLAELSKQMETTGLTDDEFKQFQDIAKRTWDRAAQRIGVDYFNSLRASMEKVIANQK
ncbi:MAG: TRAP transporter substrate-binding protein [Treponema sp.]|jgi:tripartite ATP-independent transporter DctP family solute receptor|nr:TRAP transporter substrate-binding protein [Treponema sp.]